MTDGVVFDAVAIDCSDPVALAGFWAKVLDTDVQGTGGDGPSTWT